MSFSNSNYSDIHSQLPDTIQSQTNINLGSLNFKRPIPVHEQSLYRDASLGNSHYNHYDYCELDHDQTLLLENHSRHNLNIRLRHAFLPALIFVFMALGSLLTWSCVNGIMPVRGIDSSLMGRAFDIVKEQGDTSVDSTYI
jgi:hypothetical protein